MIYAGKFGIDAHSPGKAHPIGRDLEGRLAESGVHVPVVRCVLLPYRDPADEPSSADLEEP